MIVYRRVLEVIVTIVMLSMTRSGLGQSTTGSIYGAVVDPSEASVPGAVVVAKELHTGLLQTLTTNSAGEYVFATLNPGDYTVTASAAGFKSVTQTGIALASNQNVHVAFNLVTGGATETVEVEAEVTLVDTRESQIGETIEQARVQDLPTLNRNPYDLVLITPGVSSYSADQQTGSRDGSKVVVNGLPADMVSNYLDGAYNNAYKQGGGNKIPNPDAIQEFRILTSNFDAEFGRSPGAAINIITRGGTSTYHGSAYDYVRNDRLRSRSYFTQAGTPIQPYKQNQFGGTFLHAPATARIARRGAILQPKNDFAHIRSGRYRSGLTMSSDLRTDEEGALCVCAQRSGHLFVIAQSRVASAGQHYMVLLPD